MKSIFGSLRQYLIVLLTIAAAASAWPLAEIEELDGAGVGDRPALSEDGPGLLGIVHCVSQLQRKGSAQTPSGEPILVVFCSETTSATLLLHHSIGLISPRKSSTLLYPNKTGPPSA